MNRNQNIPPDRRSVDGIIGGRSSRRRSGKVDEPFMKRHKTVGQNSQVEIGDVYRPKNIQKIDESSEKPPKTSRRSAKKQAKKDQTAALGKDSQTKKVRKWPKRLLIIMLVILLAGGGYFGYKSWSKLRNVFRGGGSSAVLCGEVEPSKLKTEGDGRVNILILGIGGAEQTGGPNLTDTIMVASINPLDNTVKLLSLPRDLWVPVDGVSKKINEAYETGLDAYKENNPTQSDEWPAIQQGFKTANSVVSNAIGIPINYDVLISYEGFREAINAVGGVGVDVPEALADPTMAWENNYSAVIARKGTQHMDSKQALMYVRSRHGSSRGDFDRAERQRAVLVALQHKVLSAGTLANPVKVSNLTDALGNNIRTNIGGEDRTCMINVAKKIDGSKAKSIDLYDYVQSGVGYGASVQVPKAGDEDFSKIQSYVRNQLKDSYLAREDAKITVLNGTTTPGLAKEVANKLKGYGYNITKVGGSSDKNMTRTQIIDVTKKDSPRYTINYLERRLGGVVGTDLPNNIQKGSADIVIIVGRDAASY